MAHWVENLRVVHKLAIGFGVVGVLVIAMAAVSVVSAGRLSTLFSGYNTVIDDKSLFANTQLDMFRARIAVKDFVIMASDDAVGRVQRHLREARDRIATGLERFGDRPDVTRRAEAIGALIDHYDASFDEVVALQDRRSEILESAVRPVGTETRKLLSAIADSAFEDGDATSAFLAGNALQFLLLGRLYAEQFLLDNLEADYTRAKQDLGQADAAMERMLLSLENPTRRDLATQAEASLTRYTAAFDDIASLIRERNAIITGTLDQIGPRVVAELEGLNAEANASQERQDPVVAAAIGGLEVVSLGLGTIAVLLSLAAAWAVTRQIAGPLRQMTGTMTALADGQLDTEIAFADRREEVGAMARAVRVFRDGLRDNARLAEQTRTDTQAREARAQRIAELTQGFDRDVSTMLDTVHSAVSGLETSSGSVASASEQSSQQATSVAAAS